MKKPFWLFLLLFLFAFGQEGARYLIITHDNFYAAIQPLAEWKNQKGMKTKVVRLSEIGSSNTQIKNYILNAYNNWNPRPEFILLVGSPDYLPSFYRNTYDTDNEYANMTGDYRAELCYGRFPVKTAAQCSTMVAKTLSYERYPYLSDTNWFKSGTVIVRQDYDADDTVYWNNVRFAAGRAIGAGYTRIDTFCNAYGHSATDIVSSVTTGRSFVLYRGSAVGNWYTPFAVNPNLTNNGRKLPIIYSFTCATMTLAAGESMVGDAWVKAGNPSNLKGAVAFIGSTHSGVNIARIRGAMTIGFFTKVFDETNWNLGSAVLAGKKEIFEQFAYQYEYEGFNLLGDPELCLWTAVPKPLAVSHPPTVPIYSQNFTVLVYQQGIPLANALVCVMKGTEVYAYGYTDSQGSVTLAINPTSLGTMLVTVTAKNCLPYEGSVQVVSGSGPYPIYYGHIINDPAPGGNNDGNLNPGEAIRLRVGIKNVGSEIAKNVRAILVSSDPRVLISDSVQYFGDILPDSVVYSLPGFAIQVAPSCTNQQRLNFTLFIQDSVGSYNQNFSLVVWAGVLSYQGYSISDPAPGGNNNGRLDPGESGKLILTLHNSGLGSLSDVLVKLRLAERDQRYVLVTDSTGHFGRINPGETKTDINDPFALSVSQQTYSGYQAKLWVLVYGIGGTYQLIDSINLVLTIGTLSQSVPTGPDGYGYFLYDNTDINSGQAPSYNWVEISSTGQIISEITNSDNAIVTFSLPFTFRYYGVDYNTITVSSNGYVVMGSSTFNSGENTQIFNGCPNLIAPFWDDLDTRQQQGYGDVYRYYDAANHRYIIEYRQVAHYGSRQTRETFEIILFDPAHYPTPTGDGEIVFQYQYVANASSNTVGICDLTQTRGLQIVYNSEYEPSAGSLVSNRAYRFTTAPPQVNPAPWLGLVFVAFSDSLGNNNGLVEPGEEIVLDLTIHNYGQVDANDVNAILRCGDLDAFVLDSIASFGDIASGATATNLTPYRIQIVETPSDSIVDFTLILTGNGGSYNAVSYFTLNLSGVTGIKENSKFEIRHRKLLIRPNPFKIQTIIHIPESEIPLSALRIYDVTGKLVKSFSISATNRKHSEPSVIIWDGTDKTQKPVPKGLYFLVLTDGKNQIIINKKIIRADWFIFKKN